MSRVVGTLRFWQRGCRGVPQNELFGRRLWVCYEARSEDRRLGSVRRLQHAPASLWQDVRQVGVGDPLHRPDELGRLALGHADHQLVDAEAEDVFRVAPAFG